MQVVLLIRILGCFPPLSAVQAYFSEIYEGGSTNVFRHHIVCTLPPNGVLKWGLTFVRCWNAKIRSHCWICSSSICHTNEVTRIIKMPCFFEKPRTLLSCCLFFQQEYHGCFNLVPRVSLPLQRDLGCVRENCLIEMFLFAKWQGKNKIYTRG